MRSYSLKCRCVTKAKNVVRLNNLYCLLCNCKYFITSLKINSKVWFLFRNMIFRHNKAKASFLLIFFVILFWILYPRTNWCLLLMHSIVKVLLTTNINYLTIYHLLVFFVRRLHGIIAENNFKILCLRYKNIYAKYNSTKIKNIACMESVLKMNWYNKFIKKLQYWKYRSSRTWAF